MVSVVEGSLDKRFTKVSLSPSDLGQKMNFPFRCWGATFRPDQWQCPSRSQIGDNKDTLGPMGEHPLSSSGGNK